ncbi:hypothetical protein DSO57_1007646 [Entomophthora muscae]|uniref:Uncharacterized protein n=1 Tax=Entomophthora muscae TaxID=34485 RepID=A0ACC2SKD8_9FUNG|nr:hypothetical protein DSO57_1007646 [Entomophthora muscae]
MLTKSSLLTVLSLLLASIHAEDGAASGEEAPIEEAVVEEKPALATWKPYGKKVYAPFFEQFDDSWQKKWIVSEAVKEKPKDSQEDEDLFKFTGRWEVEEPSVYRASEGDKGLVVKDAAKHHAISYTFKETVDNKDKPLVVQYEVKLQNGLECGGAYLKLLSKNKDFVPKKFDDKAPYTIMFGPDKCGSTNKVHFIFRHENPLTHVFEEKHLQSAPMAKHSTKLTTLYTLVVSPNNTYNIFVNMDSVKSGSLLEDFEPAVNPAKEIEDVDDKKPSDWVDVARIPDPEATKPEDWDESQPRQIPDETAVKPEDWLDNEPLEIPDPKSVKPEDWSDEDDGDWIAPTIENPKCAEASGCGEWVRPTIPNPAYKGKWSAPMIDNPAYKGEWKPRMIPNPDFFEDLHPANFNPMGAIGFEIWTMSNDIMFDNIYVGYSEEEAKEIAEATWRPKFTKEEELRSAETKTDTSFDDAEPPQSAYVEYALYHTKKFLTLAREDFVGTIKEHPKMAGALASALVSLWIVAAFILNLLFPAAKTADEAAERKKDDRAVPDDDASGETEVKKDGE